jgi:hypothetical protein
VIRTTILSENIDIGTNSFNKLITSISSKLNQQPSAIEEAKATEIDIPRETIDNDPVNGSSEISIARRVTKISRILGIIVGVWTMVLLIAIVDYNIRLSNVRENVSGLGILVVERVAPSIEIGTLIAILFVIITIALIIRPTRSRLVATGIFSTVNLILSLWVIYQIPNILYELFVIMCIAIIFNVAVMIFAVAAYKKSLLIPSKSVATEG